MNSRSGKSRGRVISSGAARPGPAVVLRPVALATMALLVAALLANSMTKELARDEQMYCTAGILLARGATIYRDFSYPSQLPYHPLLLAAVYRGFGTTHYLLAGRLLSVAGDVGVMIFILLIYRFVFGARRRAGLLFGLAAVVLFVFNPVVDYAAGYAWNHDVVILCVMASLWLFVTTDFEQRSRFWRVGLMGALLTAATFMRVTTVLVEVLFLAGLLAAAGGPWRNRSRTALPFSLAALAVMAWPLWVISRAPEAFRLNLFRIPALYGRWLHEIGMTFGKLALTVTCLGTPGYFMLLVVAGCLVGAMVRGRVPLEAREKPKAALAALLPLLFLVIAYIPPTMWQQYLAVPVPFITIAFAYPLAGLCRRADEPGGRRWYGLASCVTAVAALVSVVALPVALYRIPFVLVPEKWVPMEVHRVSADIASQAGEPCLALTLGPLYALEGGCDIYPQLASGSIVYRVADRMSAEERQVTRTVGPQTVDALAQDRPPAVVIVGVEPSRFSMLEEPLRQLVPPDWQRSTYQGTLQVYSRPRTR